MTGKKYKFCNVLVNEINAYLKFVLLSPTATNIIAQRESLG